MTHKQVKPNGTRIRVNFCTGSFLSAHRWSIFLIKQTTEMHYCCYNSHIFPHVYMAVSFTLVEVYSYIGGPNPKSLNTTHHSDTQRGVFLTVHLKLCKLFFAGNGSAPFLSNQHNRCCYITQWDVKLVDNYWVKPNRPLV